MHGGKRRWKCNDNFLYTLRVRAMPSAMCLAATAPLSTSDLHWSLALLLQLLHVVQLGGREVRCHRRSATQKKRRMRTPKQTREHNTRKLELKIACRCTKPPPKANPPLEQDTIPVRAKKTLLAVVGWGVPRRRPHPLRSMLAPQRRPRVTRMSVFFAPPSSQTTRQH